MTWTVILRGSLYPRYSVLIAAPASNHLQCPAFKYLKWASLGFVYPVEKLRYEKAEPIWLSRLALILWLECKALQEVVMACPLFEGDDAQDEQDREVSMAEGHFQDLTRVTVDSDSLSMILSKTRDSEYLSFSHTLILSPLH